MSLGQRREGLRDGLAAEADTFLGIEVGDVGNQGGNVTGTADGLVDGHLVDDDPAEILDECWMRGRNSSIFWLSISFSAMC